MRLLVLIINYALLIIWFLALLSLFSEFDMDVVIWSIMMLFIATPNLIFIHMNKPVDKEKENLKKQVEDLNNKLENNS